MTRVVMDLKKDLLKILRDRMMAQGYICDGLSGNEIAIRYFSLRRILVDVRPRKIHKSAEFSCPQQFEHRLAILINKMQSGEDVRPHLSRRTKNITMNDDLLNDWGIHHFHLNATIEADGFVTRSGPLLFAHIAPDDVYLIDVMEHGSWANDQLIIRLNKNWPHLFESLETHALPATTTWSSNERIKLRRAGISVATQIGRRVFYPLGGGSTNAGDNTLAVLQASRTLATLNHAETWICEQVKKLIGSVESHENDIELHLVEQNDEMLVMSQDARLLVSLPSIRI